MLRSQKSILRELKAAIFDIDGTLYNQSRLRLLMMSLMLRSLLKGELTIRDINTIRAFRKTRERISESESGDIDNLQFELTSKKMGNDAGDLRKLIGKWIYETPLRYIPRYKFPHLNEFLTYLRKNKVRIGFFSDYPPEKKLEALGVAADAFACSTDKSIDRFKPHPRGLVVVSQRLNVDMAKCILIGDRDEKDGRCAQRAGIPFLNVKIFGSSPYSNNDLYKYIDKWIEDRGAPFER
jgi:FMN phosphatase YigB (HAD superfamily)